VSLAATLEAIGAEFALSLERLPSPVCLLDASGTVLWQNRAAVALVGDRRGKTSAAGVPSEVVTNEAILLPTPAGDQARVESVAIPLHDDAGLVAVLKIAQRTSRQAGAARTPKLTPRELETLRLLAAGRSTDEIAQELGIARETTRNYIRRLLRTLGVHSRLAAVARARESGLV
jgi:DNA-binding CsgD family transcriptional regulator